MKAPLDQILRELLSESREDAVFRERSAFDEQAGAPQAPLVLFGAGNLGRKTLSGLRAADIEPVAFTDNDSRLWGKDVAGVPVLAPEEACRRHGESAVFVVTIWGGEGSERMGQRIAQLRALGCVRVVPFLPLFWRYADAFLPHYAADLPHRVIDQRERVGAAFDSLADEASRKEFIGEVRWRLLGDFADLGDPASTEIYFPDDLYRVAPDEVFVDCGAFDGDTIRRFLARQPEFVGEVKAFEPDPQNFRKLTEFVQALPESLRRRIQALPYAVSNRREVVRFDATGTSSASVGRGTIEVEAVRIDDVLKDCRPTYIKMDTEGSELRAIQGAAQTIAAHAPAMAISAYHSQNHLWEVPLLLNSLDPNYKLYLRPQVAEGWDLVCYAIPG